MHGVILSHLHGLLATPSTCSQMLECVYKRILAAHIVSFNARSVDVAYTSTFFVVLNYRAVTTMKETTLRKAMFQDKSGKCHERCHVEINSANKIDLIQGCLTMLLE